MCAEFRLTVGDRRRSLFSRTVRTVMNGRRISDTDGHAGYCHRVPDQGAQGGFELATERARDELPCGAYMPVGV